MVASRFGAMVQTPTETLTLEAFLQQPETKPASEFINGQCWAGNDARNEDFLRGNS
jgi:hypothetical protein